MENNLTEKIIRGDVRAAAKLMRGIEDNLPEATDELQKLYPYTGKAFIIGITGSPGVGKSTLVDALITSFRQRQMTVGVVAIDPSSPFTGGALLGDRVRMGKHNTDAGVFIRSLASRGWAGGLARAAISVMYVMDAMGKDVIIVEAVGSGQGEVDIRRLADTTIVVLAPGMGDEIQMMKAGILEAADVYVINKADKDGAGILKTQLEIMLGTKTDYQNEWKPLIVPAQALHGKGIDELTAALLQHKDYLYAGAEIMRRRRERAKLELAAAVEHSLRNHVKMILESEELNTLADNLAQRKTNPYLAAEQAVHKAMGKFREC
ncbi:MAG: methylmalonyl Co-A mutase-associated GTPase MeaB [Dehalococcoidales bacterium]|nr:methylmalonyl Co-A mutase-associated GTPase MeaB [Dehalococcoidales bacterium]